MSFMLTTEQMHNKTKTVTRRIGWGFLKPGDILQAVEKCQGLKKGEKIKKICLIRVISNTPQTLHEFFTASFEYQESEAKKEGFKNYSEFTDVLVKLHGKRTVEQSLNRIEFEFI